MRGGSPTGVEGMMIDVPAGSVREALEERLARGSKFLFDLEQRGELGEEYALWLQRWLELLARYEALDAP